MAYTHTWSITDTESLSSTGYVFRVSWELTCVKGDWSVSDGGVVITDGDLTTPYEDLTEADVLSWVWGILPGATTAEAKAAVQDVLEIQLASGGGTTTAATQSGRPWE